MIGYLLDTNVALLAGHQSRSLSLVVRSAIEEGPLFLSPLAYWEVVIKAMKGALDVGHGNGGQKRSMHLLQSCCITSRNTLPRSAISLPFTGILLTEL